MIFYRVHYLTEGGNSAGFSWHTSRRAAQSQANEAVENDPIEYEDSPPSIEKIEIKNTKNGILNALNHYADHADNG